MAYDEFGWIVNINKETKLPKDYGDSCFFMGLQCLNWILRNQIFKATLLYERVAEYDFIRHPTVKNPNSGYFKNQTSFDMMLIWDWLSIRFGLFPQPPFHYRPSKFFLGKHRHPILYSKLALYFSIILTFLLRKIPNKLFDLLFCGKKFHKLHLLFLYLSTVAEKFFSTTLFFQLQKLTDKIEKILNYEHAFFRFLSRKPIMNPIKPKHNCHEWIYQRDLRLGCNPNSDIIDFHCEKFGNKYLDLSEQFHEVITKNA